MRRKILEVPVQLLYWSYPFFHVEVLGKSKVSLHVSFLNLTCFLWEDMFCYVIQAFVEMRHGLISTCNLCLFEHGECITLEKCLRHCVACWALRDVLTLKHRQKPTSELDPLFRRSLIKEGYGKLVDWRVGVHWSGTKLVGVVLAFLQVPGGRSLEQNDHPLNIRVGTLGDNWRELHCAKLRSLVDSR